MNFLHTHRRITARNTLPPAHAPQFSTPQPERFSLGGDVASCQRQKILPGQSRESDPARTSDRGTDAHLRLILSDYLLASGDRVVSLRPRDAAALCVLARCRPGGVSDRMLCALADRRRYNAAEGEQAVRNRLARLRQAFARVGVPDPIRRHMHLGWSLAVGVEVVA